MKKSKGKRLQKLLIPLGIIAVAIIVAAIASGNTPYIPTLSASPCDGEVVSLLDGKVYEFASNYTKECSDGKYNHSDMYFPIPAAFGWENTQDSALYYTFEISRNGDMSGASEYFCPGTNIEIADLFMGTDYYYRITAHYGDKDVKSRIFNIKTDYLPRTITIDGVSNTRDIGGYYTADGKHRIKQGMIYRSGFVDNITELGKKQALGTYGINFDLDLRGSETAITFSPISDTIGYQREDAPFYAFGASGISSPEYKEALINEIKVFANPENYPILVHCSLGRDRTGTICFLINGLCGVSEKDLFMDYEMSFFSVVGSDDTGTPATKVGGDLQSLYDYIAGYSESEVLSEDIEAFMTKYLGITDEEIASIRSTLVEEVA